MATKRAESERANCPVELMSILTLNDSRVRTSAPALKHLTLTKHE